MYLILIWYRRAKLVGINLIKINWQLATFIIEKTMLDKIYVTGTFHWCLRRILLSFQEHFVNNFFFFEIVVEFSECNASKCNHRTKKLILWFDKIWLLCINLYVKDCQRDCSDTYVSATKTYHFLKAIKFSIDCTFRPKPNYQNILNPSVCSPLKRLLFKSVWRNVWGYTVVYYTGKKMFCNDNINIS